MKKLILVTAVALLTGIGAAQAQSSSTYGERDPAMRPPTQRQLWLLQQEREHIWQKDNNQYSQSNHRTHRQYYWAR
ncbi:hypothetical protein SAMN05216548_102400 [Faunimonas pinastri]|uniref:Uncharacterized protein n=1 Tax=Faunimonas pinastri TaxID=1855383 RepID=A0A1H9DAI4_9HYPH|nr:hypothetical protein [Faunimonas pinastri]SEQ10359.1 hypothetical protein SAMN05216548_102400 [Faunimonas pinastri]